MELIIIKDGHVFARARDEDEGGTYTLETVEDANMPEFPTGSAGAGKYYELDYVDGALAWVAKERPLTAEERVQVVEDRLNAMEYPEFVQPTGAHDAYAKGAKVTYNGKRYVSLIDANVWTPEVYPTGWSEVS